MTHLALSSGTGRDGKGAGRRLPGALSEVEERSKLEPWPAYPDGWNGSRWTIETLPIWPIR
jgi:hypothetical protein